MGGFGSGNHAHSHRPAKRRTVETTRILSIDSLRTSAAWQDGSGISTWTARNGRTSSLRWSWTENEDTTTLLLEYAVRGVLVTERIPLETRPQKFGGVRYFFQCPKCNKRVLKLYGIERFLCRGCQGLMYRSSQESGSLLRQLLQTEEFTQIFGSIAEGLTISPYTAEKLIEEVLSGEPMGATSRRIIRKVQRMRNNTSGK